jgi:hypothetical protein
MSTLKLNIIADPSRLKSATKIAEASLRKMQRTAESVSNGMNRALGAAGIGIGLASVTNLLKQSTKAASEDRKSQGLLAGALRNTLGATDQAIAGAEKYIRSTQLQTAVLDDELRPALATAVRATGSLASGQRILDIALDVSAQTGKDLGSVTKALSLAFQGNSNQLKRLIPGLDTTGDVISKVEKGFQGAAETAANLDPYKRLEVIFEDIKETIGEALLPALEEFSAYLVSPEGTKNVKDIVNLFVELGKGVAEVSRFLIQNITLVKALVAAVLTAKVAWTVLSGAVKLYTLLTGNAVVATKALKLALIGTGIGAIAVLVGTLAEAWIGANDAQEDYLDGQPEDVYIPSVNPYQVELDNNIQAAKDAATKTADAVKKVLQDKMAGIKRVAENFRNTLGLAFGTYGKDENSVFNVDVVINKLKRLVNAAKGFAGNLARLRKAGADESVISEIVGMGPAQGNIVAKGLLGSGKLSEYLKLRGSLYDTGAQAGAQQALSGDATYNIKLEGTNVKASDIIREIQILEKKTGRKYLLNG